jgi:hypothetical protein
MQICKVIGIFFLLSLGLFDCIILLSTSCIFDTFIDVLIGHFLALLDLKLDELHLVDGDCTFAINPLSVDELLVFVPHYSRNT